MQYKAKNTKTGAEITVSREEKQRLGPNWVFERIVETPKGAPAPTAPAGKPATLPKEDKD